MWMRCVTHLGDTKWALSDLLRFAHRDPGSYFSGRMSTVNCNCGFIYNKNRSTRSLVSTWNCIRMILGGITFQRVFRENPVNIPSAPAVHFSGIVQIKNPAPFHFVTENSLRHISQCVFARSLQASKVFVLFLCGNILIAPLRGCFCYAVVALGIACFMNWTRARLTLVFGGQWSMRARRVQWTFWSRVVWTMRIHTYEPTNQCNCGPNIENLELVGCDIFFYAETHIYKSIYISHTPGSSLLSRYIKIIPP